MDWVHHSGSDGSTEPVAPQVRSGPQMLVALSVAARAAVMPVHSKGLFKLTEKIRSRTIVVPPLKASVRRRLHADELRLHADLGKITRSWANLHEHLASVLARTLECDQAIANSMWHTLPRIVNRCHHRPHAQPYILKKERDIFIALGAFMASGFHVANFRFT